MKHLDCPAEELEVHIVSGVGNSDADLGRSCTEGRGPGGGLDQQSESLPAEGAAASELWLTVAIWPVHDFQGKSEICISVKSPIFLKRCQLNKKLTSLHRSRNS